MAVVIYQASAGYVKISGKDVPLDNCNMTSWLNPITNKYEISFRKVNGDGAWAVNIPLENIEDNADNTYATIGDWNTWWGGLVSSATTGTDPDTGLGVKAYVNGYNFVVDKELTETGFDGVENTDWERTFIN